MHQVASSIWNQIAEQESLSTEWAQQIFGLPPEEMDQAINAELERLTPELGGDKALASTYLEVMPLLWENAAIRRYLSRHPDLLGALPEVLTADEAVMLASQDHRLTKSDQKLLKSLLQKPPT